MTESTVAVLAFLVLGWAITSGTLARHNVTGPLVFAITGYVLGNPDWGPLTIDVEAESIHVIAELALALVLFSDAERVNIAELRRDVSLPVRLLAIGLPLSIAGGGVLAAVILDDIPWALAGFIGAALAPTDAALSAPVINDERIPLRLRRALNVESGLNDGIATPVVSFMLAVAASQIGATTHAESFQAGAALRELAVGALVGLTAGVGGAALDHAWSAVPVDRDGRSPAGDVRHCNRCVRDSPRFGRQWLHQRLRGRYRVRRGTQGRSRRNGTGHGADRPRR